RGYCASHYSRESKKGFPLEPRCNECDRPVSHNGLCKQHHLEVVRGNVKRPCGYGSCSREMRFGGLCNLHYNRKVNGRDMDALVTSEYPEGEWVLTPGRQYGYAFCSRRNSDGSIDRRQHHR